MIKKLNNLLNKINGLVHLNIVPILCLVESTPMLNQEFSVISIILLSISALLLILCLLLSVAYAILIERKLLASIQRRRGPNYVGFLGLLQPIADAVKLILKETIIPAAADRIIFLIAPLLALTLSLLN
jgi:NADH:ubiquinone oxidoreductase subunit H